MEIQTGRGNIPLITLVGIWSISALNALPGLAVSPILGKLYFIFTDSIHLNLLWSISKGSIPNRDKNDDN